MVRVEPVQIARYIDHTLLRPDATADEVRRHCDDTARFGFAAACVASGWAALARERLDRAGAGAIPVCCVVGFPFGSASSAAKAAEARQAVEDGAGEIDAVINVGYLRSGLTGLVARDLADVVGASGDAVVKVILETCYLTDDEKVIAGRLAREAGAGYVKTSTGFGPGGARLEDVALLKREVPGIRIKASGGIRTFAQAQAFLAAGASRIGTSAGPAIVAGARDEGKH